MATSRVAPDLLSNLLSRIADARAQTDALFDLLPPNSFYERPIAERHRLIFYLGHLEAFDWNLLSGPLELGTHDAAFDKLFAFGIDPIGGGLPTDKPGDWPNIAKTEKYKSNIRAHLDEALRKPDVSREPLLADGTLLHVAVEHRLMHAETLSYLLHNLPLERKIPHPAPMSDPRPAPAARFVAIPAGTATLGRSRSAGAFGWDNEFEMQQVSVPEFSIGVFPVTNGEFMEFVQACGYEDSRYWRPEDREWKRQQRLAHPPFWLPRSSSVVTDPDTQWEYRSMFGAIPLPPSWPVYVSYAEAAAFARWTGMKLPTEAQWHRAAYGTPQGVEREYPWGDGQPDRSHGNFHFKNWHAAPVDAHPAGASAFGVHDLIGNGWEWTSTPFGPLPGFTPFPFYKGYSADFFDGKHFVMKGGSARTDASMLRRSFRNWFQPHYPYVYATFRCVQE
ncbi:MAG TPA: SUMF1/EgtB/PvdO family nonheme iron enzyme [Candidatus Acidoferrales bacterium]|nr:SUMF1/EgtB/PvdO family nonheme iron enzyme [Candidatus Acidoferrales bacterium]